MATEARRPPQSPRSYSAVGPVGALQPHEIDDLEPTTWLTSPPIATSRGIAIVPKLQRGYDMIRVLLCSALAISVSGCAGLARISTYHDADGRTSVHVGRAEYKISVHPEDDTILVQEAFGGALGGAVFEGLTFGAADTSPPIPVPRLAAAVFLGQFECSVEQIYTIEDITSEAVFACPAGVRPSSNGNVSLCTNADPYGPSWMDPSTIPFTYCD